jgi:ribonuclease M5
LRKRKKKLQRIEQIIIVEGRDDESAIKSALTAETIITHGYHISKKVWNLIEKAYYGPGIIIFTDPDHAGEKIRKRIAEKFPNAGHAYLSKEEATKERDIGIENASADNIRKALEKARCRKTSMKEEFTIEDLRCFGLTATEEAAFRRDKLGQALGIGFGNTKTFLSRLNSYGITREEFTHHAKALFADNHSKDKKET